MKTKNSKHKTAVNMEHIYRQFKHKQYYMPVKDINQARHGMT